MSYFKPQEFLEETVDKIIVCLVGQPRGISLKCWRDGLPYQFKKTLDMCEKKKPEIHFVCSTWNEDSFDRYIDSGEGGDFRRAGLYKEISWDTLKPKLDKPSVFLKKEKFMKYCNEVFNWADSVNFSFPSQFKEIDDWKQKIPHFFEEDTPGFPNSDLGKFDHISPSLGALGQYISFLTAVKDNEDLFKDVTRNTVVIRMRWDMCFWSDVTLWDFARGVIRDLRNFDDDGNKFPFNWHELYGDLSPVVGVIGLGCYKGLFQTNDYFHTFDGIGAKFFVDKFMGWCFEDPERRLLRWVRNVNYDPNKPIDSDKNFLPFPEVIIAKFFIENGYTIYDASTGLFEGRPNYSKSPGELGCFAWGLNDEWRTEWYDWDLRIDEISNLDEL